MLCPIVVGICKVMNWNSIIGVSCLQKEYSYYIKQRFDKLFFFRFIYYHITADGVERKNVIYNTTYPMTEFSIKTGKSVCAFVRHILSAILQVPVHGKAYATVIWHSVTFRATVISSSESLHRRVKALRGVLTTRSPWNGSSSNDEIQRDSVRSSSVISVYEIAHVIRTSIACIFSPRFSYQCGQHFCFYIIHIGRYLFIWPCRFCRECEKTLTRIWDVRLKDVSTEWHRLTDNV